MRLIKPLYTMPAFDKETISEKFPSRNLPESEIENGTKDVTQLEKWNSLRVIRYRYFAALYSFWVMGELAFDSTRSICSHNY